MFTYIDILTISIIIVLFVFLFILFQLEKSITKPRTYLRFVLGIIIFVSISEELVFLKLYSIVIWMFPFILACDLSIYPLIFLYSRDLIFSDKSEFPKNGGLQKIDAKKAMTLPILALIILSSIYYLADYEIKLKIVSTNIGDFAHGITQYRIMQYLVIPIYYIQTFFYLAATLQLISLVRKNSGTKPWELLIVKYLSFYVVAVILYEIMLLLNSVIFAQDSQLLWIVERFSSLLFIIAGLYLSFKQSLVLIQSILDRYSAKLEKKNSIRTSRYALTDAEKKDIEEAIQNYFNDTKIYLDPNLKLETLAKKVHITARRISNVINEVYGANFNQFINEFRISEAKKLISRNPESTKIEMIYTEVGFNSRSAFNHAFKESTGLSPSEYIKKTSSLQTVI